MATPIDGLGHRRRQAWRVDCAAASRVGKREDSQFLSDPEHLANLVGSSVHRWEEERRSVLDLDIPRFPPSPNLLTLRALPLPTNSQSIQQRDMVVKDIYALLLEPHTSAVVLTGIAYREVHIDFACT